MIHLSDFEKVKLGLTFNIPWWQFSERDGQALIWLCNLVQAQNIYEIGCWTGHSTSYLAHYAKINHGKVTVIDTFKGSPIMTAAVGESFNARKEFDKNMKILKLNKIINVLEGYSDDFYKNVEDNSIDLMFIDGDHRYSYASKDIDNWFPKVRNGGILCGHDCESKFWDEDKIDIEEGSNGIHHGVVKAVFEKFPNANIEHRRIWWVKK